MSLKVKAGRKFTKPGETRRKSQKPVPGTRRFFNQENSLKTRSLLAKSGGLAALKGDPIQSDRDS